MDDAIRFHAFELLSQHLLGNIGNRPLQVRKPQDLAAEQMKENNQLPPALE
jgi:hypothetical protein